MFKFKYLIGNNFFKRNFSKNNTNNYLKSISNKKSKNETLYYNLNEIEKK